MKCTQEAELLKIYSQEKVDKLIAKKKKKLSKPYNFCRHMIGNADL